MVLLRISADGSFCPFTKSIYPTAFVTGIQGGVAVQDRDAYLNLRDLASEAPCHQALGQQFHTEHRSSRWRRRWLASKAGRFCAVPQAVTLAIFRSCGTPHASRRADVALAQFYASKVSAPASQLLLP